MKRRTLAKFRASRSTSSKPKPKHKPSPTPKTARRTRSSRRPTSSRSADPAQPQPQHLHHHHHHVYVVLLDPAVRRLRGVASSNRNAQPHQPCVYVGMTGLSPEERFENHRQGIKAAYAVRRYGLRLLPELYAHLNPMPFEAAAQMERDLAEDLRRAGFTVTGGH